MDRRFLDDCGLETHDSLSNELDTIRSEYFGLDLNNSSDSEGPDVTADETSGISLAGSSTPRNDRVTPVLDQSSTDDDDFITPVRSLLETGCGCRYGKQHCRLSIILNWIYSRPKRDFSGCIFVLDYHR